MKVTYHGPARSYSWQTKDGKVAGTLRPGDDGTVPDEVLAGSLAQKGVRHVFKKADGEMLVIGDLSKKAQTVAAVTAPEQPTG